MGKIPLRALIMSALAMLLAGCVAETVRKNNPRPGPVKAVGYVDMGGGEVRYSTDGWGWFVAGRRRAAKAIMSHICGKLKPVVTEEFTQEDADVPYSQEDISVTMQLGAQHFTLANYTHLVFECAYSSTATVKAPPVQGLPPPPRPAQPLVEVYAPGYSSATATTVVAVGTAAPVQVAAPPPAPPAVPVVTFSSAAATPALRGPLGPALPRPVTTAPPAASWIGFPSGWILPPAAPKIQTSSSVPAAVGTSSAAPSAVPSGVKTP